MIANQKLVRPEKDNANRPKDEKKFPVIRVMWHGIPIEIENKAGSIRSGVNKDGKKWQTKMSNHYGRISRTKGLDGDMEDVFLRVSPREKTVFKISTKDPSSGESDETKWMLGFHNKKEAENAFFSAYDRPEFFQYCEEVPFEQFKDQALNNQLQEMISFSRLIREVKKIKYPDCYVKFLPSEEGAGFTATIRHDLSTKDWSAWYGHLKGVAQNFEPKNDFEHEVKSRLISQGVKFEGIRSN